MIKSPQGFVIDKIWKKVSKQDNLSQEENAFKERNRRVRRIAGVMGGVALVGIGAAFVPSGIQRAIERNPIVTNDTTAQGGKPEIIAFDADYESHCWTATTLQVRGAGVKDELKVAGVSVGWQESKIDAQYRQLFCIDATTLSLEINQQTGHVNIDIPDKDSIRTQSDVVLGTLEPYGDQTPGYVFTEGLISLGESLPVIEDWQASKDAAKLQDKKTSTRLNVGLILAAIAARGQCEKETWELANEPFENGVTRMVSIGLTAASAMRPKAGIDPTNISVTVAGKPISELDTPGDKTNLDEAYQKIVDYDKNNENFSILSAVNGSCEVSDEVKKLPTQTDPTIKTASRQG